MLLVFKLILVAIGLVSQDRALPDREVSPVSELDTLALSGDHPEWVLARRAMASEGLCRLNPEAPARQAAPRAPVDDPSIVRLVSEACE